MIKTLFFKQSKPLTVKILGAVFLILVGSLVYEGVAPLNQIIIMSILGMVLLGYSISYEFRSDYTNKKYFQLFGITVFKQKLDVIFPDYITVFSASYKQGSEWGPVAALGKETKEGSYVVRLFKGNKHFTVCKSNSLGSAKNKASRLAELLKVELVLKN